MMQLPDNEKYSASDIERYYSGKMSPEERNALEKAALSDPFLADAIEGYAYTKTPGNDSIKLNNRLEERLRKKENKPLLLKLPTWTKVAALIAIIAGCGLIIFKTVLPGNRSVAARENKMNKIELRNEARTPKDSIANGSNAGTATETTAPDQTPDRKSIVNKQSSPDKSSKIASGIIPLERNDEQAKVATKEVTISKPGILLDSQPSRQNLGNGQPIGYASAPATMNKAYLNNKRDSNAYSFNRAQSASIDRKKDFENDTLKNVDVVLKPIPDQLNEVVVSKSVPKNKNARNTEITIQDTLEPASGWNNFNDYIANNIKSPEELHIKPISGDVQLSFDVDKSGEPINIKVDKSLCEKCDEEAIRLLKEGPKWKNKKSKKRRISIKF